MSSYRVGQQLGNLGTVVGVGDEQVSVRPFDGGRVFNIAAKRLDHWVEKGRAV